MDLHYRRPQFAEELARVVLGRSVLATSTLFLGAPRRTGKSTFLMDELQPALEALGALVLYVDLWKNKEQDPADLIAFAVANALAREQGSIARAAQAAGLTKVSIQGVEFSLDTVGKQAGATLADALAEIQSKAARPVVFIVDEAQHAIRSPGAMTAMFSLKSARDTINKPGVTQLGLVMSGSDRDKLLRLVHGNAAPFMGSGINALPVLDKGYTDMIAGRLAVEKPGLQIDNERLYAAFQRFNHRPEELRRGIDAIAGPFGPAQGDNFNDLLDQQAERYVQELHGTYVTAYEGLTELQRAVLTRVLSHGANGQLFTAQALAQYSQAHGRQVLPGAARSAVEKLRDLDPPLIWKSARGDYAPENSGMRAWYEDLVANGAWPPT